jgi:hypothetical protein
MLTEPDTGGTFGYAPLNRLRERIAALRAVAEAADAALVIWGQRPTTDAAAVALVAKLEPVERMLRATLAAWRATCST